MNGKRMWVIVLVLIVSMMQGCVAVAPADVERGSVQVVAASSAPVSNVSLSNEPKSMGEVYQRIFEEGQAKAKAEVERAAEFNERNIAFLYVEAQKAKIAKRLNRPALNDSIYAPQIFEAQKKLSALESVNAVQAIQLQRALPAAEVEALYEKAYINGDSRAALHIEAVKLNVVPVPPRVSSASDWALELAYIESRPRSVAVAPRIIERDAVSEMYWNTYLAENGGVVPQNLAAAEPEEWNDSLGAMYMNAYVQSHLRAQRVALENAAARLEQIEASHAPAMQGKRNSPEIGSAAYVVEYVEAMKQRLQAEAKANAAALALAAADLESRKAAWEARQQQQANELLAQIDKAMAAASSDTGNGDYLAGLWMSQQQAQEAGLVRPSSDSASAFDPSTARWLEEGRAWQEAYEKGNLQADQEQKLQEALRLYEAGERNP